MLWQFGAGERLSYRIVADVCDLAQTIQQAQRLKDAGINADADIGIAGLNFLQSRARGEGTLRHNRHRQSPTSAGVVDVCAELAQGPPHSSGRIMWSWHLTPSYYR